MKVAQVRIYRDEWWPVPSYERELDGYEFYGPIVEVPDAVLAEYDAAEERFNAAANALADYAADK